MFELVVKGGEMAGTRVVARRFPLKVGSAPHMDFRITGSGVWDHHLTLENDASGSFFLIPHPQAIVFLNDYPISERTRIRPGDVITLGSVQLQIDFAPVNAKSFIGAEAFAWATILSVFLAQLLLLWLVESKI